MNFERIVILAFLLIASFLGVDLSDDLSHGADFTHAVFEGMALLVSSAMLAGYLKKLVTQLVDRQKAISMSLTVMTKDRDLWRTRAAQYLRGLGQAIDEQFQQWCLSDSEKDIGLLMLKGFSHKEIAQMRGTSERTVRQQAASIYEKSGVENKNQLSAFFLEDLMLPKTKATPTLNQ